MSHKSSVMLALEKAWSTYIEFHTRAPFKHLYLSYIGLATFPAYYVVWTYIFPQPYENMALRGVGVAICMVHLMRGRWPDALKPFYYQFTYLSMMYGLPFFFTFMTLKNGASSAWLMSLMAALVFVVLVYDILNVFIVSTVGSLLGIAAFYYTDGVQPLPEPYLIGLPIFLFTLAAVVFLAYSERLIAQEQFLAAELLASSIAHEMRTPLLGIRLDCERVQADISLALAAASWAAKNGYDGNSLTASEATAMQGALERIREHALSANHIIDLMLANVAQKRVDTSDFKIYSFGEVIDTALDRYHFRRGQAERVRVRGDTTATFWGSEQLMVHVIFNLLRNALKAIDQHGDGIIEIIVTPSTHENELAFTDTGAGVPPELLPLIFMPFVTGGSRMQGTGVGLAFCKMVIEAFGGRISCHSKVGISTTFTINLPRPSSSDGAVH